jgi:hypothetical protein
MPADLEAARQTFRSQNTRYPVAIELVAREIRGQPGCNPFLKIDNNRADLEFFPDQNLTGTLGLRTCGTAELETKRAIEHHRRHGRRP